MKRNYPFLRDPRAVLEIRKHQWIESEKAQKEIGFATAAVDWITKYGEEWKRFHAISSNDKNVLIESRKYRRFELFSHVTLVQDGVKLIAETINVSLKGLLCIISKYLHPDSKVAIQWGFDSSDRSGLVFEGTVERVSALANQQGKYRVLLRFNEWTQEKLENFEYLKQAF